jgi:hypothetical protein
VWGGAETSQPWIIRPIRDRCHHVGRPALHAHVKTERVAVVVRCAKNEYRVGEALANLAC